MNFEKLETLVESVPEVIKVKLFGRMVDATIEEYGAQANGYFIALETESPEGYHVKFAIFDDAIETVLTNRFFIVMAIETGENGRQLAISKHDHPNYAIKAAERYDRPHSREHNYKHIEVWSISEHKIDHNKIVIWRDGEKLTHSND